MYKVEKYKQIEFCTKEEFVDRDYMQSLGFKVVTARGRNNNKNKTDYYYRDDLKYVYAECYFASDNLYTRLILSKDIVVENGLYGVYRTSPKVIKIALSRNSNDTVLFAGSEKQLLRAKITYKCHSFMYKYTTLNVLDSKKLFKYSEDSIKQGIIFPMTKLHKVSIREEPTGTYILEIQERLRSLRALKVKLKEDGFNSQISKTNTLVLIQEFSTKYDAIKMLAFYEDKYYGVFKTSPFDNVSGHFDMKFNELILGTGDPDEIYQVILKKYQNNAYVIARYNLEEEYEKRGMTYNKDITLLNQQLIPEER